MGTEFQFCKIKRFKMLVIVARQCKLHLIMVRMVNFMFCIFYQDNNVVASGPVPRHALNGYGRLHRRCPSL